MSNQNASECVVGHHDKPHEEMLRRGLELLKVRGAADLSLRELARLVGVSQSQASRHFGNKEGMLATLATEGFHALMNDRRTVLREDVRKEVRLRMIMRLYVEFALRQLELFHLMFGPRIANKRKYPQLMKASAASFQFLSNAISEFMAENSEPGHSPHFSVIAVWSCMHGLATLLGERDSGLCQIGDGMVDDVCTVVTNLLLSDLKPAHAEEETTASRSNK